MQCLFTKAVLGLLLQTVKCRINIMFFSLWPLNEYVAFQSKISVSLTGCYGEALPLRMFLRRKEIA